MIPALHLLLRNVAKCNLSVFNANFKAFNQQKPLKRPKFPSYEPILHTISLRVLVTNPVICKQHYE